MHYIAIFVLGFMVGVVVMAFVRDWAEIFSFETAYDAPLYPVDGGRESADEAHQRLTLVADHGRKIK